MPKIKFNISKNLRFARMMNEAGLPDIDQRPQMQPNPQPPNSLPNINMPMTNTARATPELQNLIRNLIQDIIRGNNPQEEDLIDEQITSRDNLSELDKIPDLVRCLRDFSGDPAEYTAWKKSVDRIFEIYHHLRGTAKYFGILSVVRNKIIGQANISLESYNIPLNWNAIKQCLNTHYADKRDIGTLEYQLTTLIQGNKTIEGFYQKVYSHFSLILNKISSSNHDRTTATVLIESYRNKALDTFIRGLNGDLPRLLAIREPTDLPQALYLCNKLANQNYRSGYANSNQRTSNSRTYVQNSPPPPPPRQTMQRQFFPELTYYGRGNIPMANRNNQSYNNRPQLNNGFSQQYNNYPQQNNNHSHQNNNYSQQNNNQYQPYNNYPNNPRQNHQYNPPRPLAPKPLPRPEPMDIDHSVRSQQANYANRPKVQSGYLGKRENNQNSNLPPQKIQRNYHVTTNAYDMSGLEQCLNEQTELQPFNEYLEEYDTNEPQPNSNLNYNDIADVHFLG